jgi:hypothetical protein
MLQRLWVQVYRLAFNRKVAPPVYPNKSYNILDFLEFEQKRIEKNLILGKIFLEDQTLDFYTVKNFLLIPIYLHMYVQIRVSKDEQFYQLLRILMDQQEEVLKIHLIYDAN